jgi:hypothetical protein
MIDLMDYPFLTFVISFIVLWLAVRVGNHLQEKVRPLAGDSRDDFSVVQSAAMTLLGLLIGFTFSMAISRYDQRKTYEEAEANAIGTEYVRAGLLPAADMARIQELLRQYLDQRVLFYTTHDVQQLKQIDSQTSQLQNDLWSVVQARGVAQPTPVVAVAVSGMNDVLNSQGYTLAAWLNRIPPAAWILLGAIAIVCNLLIGYGARARSAMLFLVFPFIVSISFFFIADIDSARRGVIRVRPQNLIILSQSLHSH